MSAYDQVLVKNAEKYMVEFNLDEFKKTHPKLYKTIIESMKAVDTSLSI